MLTRDKLGSKEWTAIRNTPHLVMLAVSGAGGSALDSMLERHAGLKGIVEAMHSTHPLLRRIADAAEILEAQESVRSWIYTLPDEERTPARIEERALESMREALVALATKGKPDDVSLYQEFVLSTAMRVARAAREGDFLGIDGVRVSAGESQFIEKLKAHVVPKAA
jgi:hypothetical protein